MYTDEFNTSGIALRWTNVPSWTGKNVPGSVMLQETRIQPYVMVQIFTMEKNNVHESNEISNLPRIEYDIIFETICKGDNSGLMNNLFSPIFVIIRCERVASALFPFIEKVKIFTFIFI